MVAVGFVLLVSAVLVNRFVSEETPGGFEGLRFIK
jgi:hypothetical protein